MWHSLITGIWEPTNFCALQLLCMLAFSKNSSQMFSVDSVMLLSVLTQQWFTQDCMKTHIGHVRLGGSMTRVVMAKMLAQQIQCPKRATVRETWGKHMAYNNTWPSWESSTVVSHRHYCEPYIWFSVINRISGRMHKNPFTSYCVFLIYLL